MTRFTLFLLSPRRHRSQPEPCASQVRRRVAESRPCMASNWTGHARLNSRQSASNGADPTLELCYPVRSRNERAGSFVSRTPPGASFRYVMDRDHQWLSTATVARLQPRVDAFRCVVVRAIVLSVKYT